MLTAAQQQLVLEYRSMALGIARAHSWDDEAESAAMLALAKAVDLHATRPEIAIKPFISMRVRLAVRRALARPRTVTNLESILENTPAREASALEALPERFAEIAKLFWLEKRPLRDVAKRVGLPRREVRERIAQIKEYLNERDC